MLRERESFVLLCYHCPKLSVQCTESLDYNLDSFSTPPLKRCNACLFLLPHTITIPVGSQSGLIYRVAGKTQNIKLVWSKCEQAFLFHFISNAFFLSFSVLWLSIMRSCLLWSVQQTYTHTHKTHAQQQSIQKNLLPKKTGARERGDRTKRINRNDEWKVNIYTEKNTTFTPAVLFFRWCVASRR